MGLFSFLKGRKRPDIIKTDEMPEDENELFHRWVVSGDEEALRKFKDMQYKGPFLICIWVDAAKAIEESLEKRMTFENTTKIEVLQKWSEVYPYVTAYWEEHPIAVNPNTVVAVWNKPEHHWDMSFGLDEYGSHIAYNYWKDLDPPDC